MRANLRHTKRNLNIRKYELRSKKQKIESAADKEDVDTNSSEEGNLTEPSTKILDLNDDCFDEIFGYLSYDDILSVSQVCTRFEARARELFKRKKHNLEVFSVRGNTSIESKLLRHIGPSLLKLEIFFGEDVIDNQRIIDIVTEYCVENLTEVTLHCLTNRNKLRKSFKQVNKLTLSFCDLVGRFKLTKWFPHLTTLTYNYTKNLKKFMKQNIPTVHTLNINYVTTQVETISMLISNPQIKNLSLNFVSHGGLVIQHSLLTAIDKALPELQTLNLKIDRVPNFETVDLPLYFFKHLKALKVENYADYSNASLINHLAMSYANLEQLQLRFSDIPGDSNSYSCISKYKNLRILQVMPVGRSLGIDVILMLIHQLPLLEKIEQTADFANISPWTSDDVGNFLRSSNQMMELTFVFVYEAQSKFNRTLKFMETLFKGSKWMVKCEERLASKIFDTYGIGMMQKQLVIRIAKVH